MPHLNLTSLLPLFALCINSQTLLLQYSKKLLWVLQTVLELGKLLDGSSKFLCFCINLVLPNIDLLFSADVLHAMVHRSDRSVLADNESATNGY